MFVFGIFFIKIYFDEFRIYRFFYFDGYWLCFSMEIVNIIIISKRVLLIIYVFGVCNFLEVE